jgi:2-dehydropantoate 2-reductase
MKIIIVGAGAAGMLFGTFLSKGGNEVIFVEIKNEIVEAINAHGIGFMEAEAEGHKDIVYQPARAVLDATEIQECDLVLIMVKSFDTYAAVQSVAHLISKKSPVLSLQTGLGNIEIIERVERRKNILGGFTYMAGASLGLGVVRLGGMGKTYLGAINGGSHVQKSHLIADVFNQCGMETEVTEKVVKRLWCKILIFAAISPLSGILQVKNGQLLDKMESITLAKRLIDEGRMVALADGVNLAEYDLYDLFF